MGVFSKYLRFREAGEEANVNNVQEYGQPVRSLFTTSKVFTLHKKTDITDDRENVVYRSWTKFPSLHDKTDVTDAEGNQVAHIERKLLTLHERHFITMADGTSFQLSNELSGSKEQTLRRRVDGNDWNAGWGMTNGEP